METYWSPTVHSIFVTDMLFGKFLELKAADVWLFVDLTFDQKEFIP